jgi:hypothetical protein
LLGHGWWFSPGTPASTTTSGRHDIAEILLKESGVKRQKSKSNVYLFVLTESFGSLLLYYGMMSYLV